MFHITFLKSRKDQEKAVESKEQEIIKIVKKIAHTFKEMLARTREEVITSVSLFYLEVVSKRYFLLLPRIKFIQASKKLVSCDSQ